MKEGRLSPAPGEDAGVKGTDCEPLVKRSQAAGVVALQSACTAPRDRDDSAVAAGYVAVASFGQRRLWMLDRLLPDKTVYNEAWVERVTGPLDVLALERALGAIVDRHHVLRTGFEVIDGELCQVVTPAPASVLHTEDLGTLPATERAERARQRVASEAAHPFDLRHGPLFRARLLRLAPEEHWLLLMVHHIAFDRWSAAVLYREFAAAYGAFARGEPWPLRELPMQFADYAVWQREALAGERLDRLTAYWKTTLADLPTLELPLDRLRPPAASFRGGQVEFEIDASLTRALKALSQRECASLFMTLLAAFTVLLGRWSGQEDLAIGVPVAGRSRPEFEDLIGFFVNMVVMRTDLTGDPGFTTLLARVRRTALDAYSHSELPFEKLVEALAPSRDLARNPLYQVSFRLGNTPPVSWQLPGLATQRIQAVIPTMAKFDLSVGVNETQDRLRVRAEYACDLFDAASIEAMTRQFRTLLQGIVDDPLQRVSRLPLQSAAERERLLTLAHPPSTAYPHDASIDGMFEAQVARRPEALALVDAQGALSYRELNARANRLARVLCADPATPGRCIGLCLERGRDQVIGALAILKARATYVPLDPELPPERLAYMLDDARVSLVLTAERLLPRLPPGACQQLCIDRDFPAEAGAPDGDPVGGNAATDLAYVMYTSGSTGAAKGVAIPHRAVVRLVCGSDYVALGPDEIVAHVANPAFDASTFEVWGALLNGAQLAVIPRAVVLSPRELEAALVRERITTLFLTTALFNQMAREVPAAFRHCRNVLFGGEAAEPQWVDVVLRTAPPRRLIHVYGPTETTTFATWHEVDMVEARATTIPIGRPIANTEVYVLDAHLEPAAVGVPGEIFIGGPGLAREYLGRQQLSAERFVRHPFAADAAARLYRTGDRARIRADGAIEFLGRLDRQVKLRGHRIELEEIEAAILRLPDMRAAAVVLRGDTTDNRRLVAYVERGANSGTPPNLWSELKRMLPEYMLPASVVWLKSMPLNANGKINRAALPALGEGGSRVGTPTAPRDIFEHALVGIWERVLNVTPIGVFDHFFDIGGHSLLAARLCDEIERETGLEAPLSALFEDDTVAGLARVLLERPRSLDAPLIALNLEGTLTPLVFLHGDLRGGGFYCRSLSRALGTDQPMVLVQPHGVGMSIIPDTIEAMALDRIRRLRELVPHGPYIVGGYCVSAFVAFEMARQLIAQGEQVPAVVVIEARAPGDGEAGEESAAYVTIDRQGQVRALAPHDRSSDMQLRYVRAMRRYRGGACASHLVLIRTHALDGSTCDADWRGLAASAEIHVIDGNHATIVTQGGELARVIGPVMARCGKASPG
jgi:amino acid adenylation domain-containing protein